MSRKTLFAALALTLAAAVPALAQRTAPNAPAPQSTMAPAAMPAMHVAMKNDVAGANAPRQITAADFDPSLYAGM